MKTTNVGVRVGVLSVWMPGDNSGWGGGGKKSVATSYPLAAKP